MATSRTGSRLLTNGYFLLAYSILTSRKRKSIFLLNYLLNTFCNYDIEENREELEYEIG